MATTSLVSGAAVDHPRGRSHLVLRVISGRDGLRLLLGRSRRALGGLLGAGRLGDLALGRAVLGRFFRRELLLSLGLFALGFFFLLLLLLLVLVGDAVAVWRLLLGRGGGLPLLYGRARVR